MIKRPLAVSALVFILILCTFLIGDDSLLRRNPVKSNADGEKQIAGFLQGDVIQVYGVISDYEYNDRYGQITTEVTVTDVHILAPDLTNDKSYNLLDTDSQTDDKSNFQKKEEWKKAGRWGQKIILYLNKEETLSIGESVMASGTLSFFEKATNPGQFDAEKYYKNKDVLFALKKTEILRKSGVNFSLRQELKEFADGREKRLEYFLPEAYASILKAMLFGDKKELDEETKQLYQDNGIAHILAISGLHISMLGMAVYRLLRRLPLPHFVPLIGSEIFLLLYGCMVGFSASAFRAIGMFTFLLVSKIVKRSYDMLTAVAFTAMLQLLYHPGYLFDCGFQLSYMAIIGMAVVLPTLQKITEGIGNRYIKKGISLVLPSLSVSLMTAPVLIWHYHELSFFSIVLNVVVIPLVSVLLLSTIVMLILDPILTPLAWLCTVPVRLILGFYEYSCRFLELFPIGQKNIAQKSLVLIFIYYGIFLLMTALVNQKRNLYQFLFPFVAAVLLLFPVKPGFSVWVLDVGQGDCSVIFTNEGKCFVIDCGSTSKSSVGEKRLIPFLKYYGIGKVDAVFVTHADEDHMNGVIELMACAEEENIKLSCVVLHEQTLRAEPEAWEELLQTADQKKIPVKQIGQGDRVLTPSICLTCLYPLNSQAGLTGNASSMVLCLETQKEENLQMLFTGDLEKEGEQRIVEAYGSKKVGDGLHGQGQRILKVGHHGSSGSSSSAFLEWWMPDTALISCGKNNTYGHPHKETLDRLYEAKVTVRRTDEQGAIRIGGYR